MYTLVQFLGPRTRSLAFAAFANWFNIASATSIQAWPDI
jgi:hypothetical protein